MSSKRNRLRILSQIELRRVEVKANEGSWQLGKSIASAQSFIQTNGGVGIVITNPRIIVYRTIEIVGELVNDHH